VITFEKRENRSFPITRDETNFMRTISKRGFRHTCDYGHSTTKQYCTLRLEARFSSGEPRGDFDAPGAMQNRRH